MEEVQFTYRNYKGEIELRRVVPDSIEFISNPGFGYQPGWFLSGLDLDRDQRRSFFLANIVFSDDEKYYRIKLKSE